MAARPLQHLAADARCREAVRPRQQGSAALQEHVDARPRAVDVRPRPRSRSSTGSRPSSPRRPSSPKPISPRSTPATLMARRSRWARRSSSTISPPAPAEPGLYRTVTGAESLALGLVAGCQLAGLHDVLRLLSDHPGEPAAAPSGAAQGIRDHHLPGGGRDRGDLRGDRRELCRPARHHLVVGPGHRAQDRGDRPRGHDRAAAGRSSIRSAAGRRPACRPRPSSPTSTRRSTAATATRRCR